MLEGEDQREALHFWVTNVQHASFSVLCATRTWLCNHLSISILALLILWSLLFVSCNSATWHNRSSTFTHLLRVHFHQGKVLSTHCNLPLVLKFPSRSVWVEMSGFRGFLCGNFGFRSEVSSHHYGRDLEHVPGLLTYKQGAGLSLCALLCKQLLHHTLADTLYPVCQL